jgi:hypothetical protein
MKNYYSEKYGYDENYGYGTSYYEFYVGGPVPEEVLINNKQEVLCFYRWGTNCLSS